ncbi:MAG: HlyD family efflux transporter periplasmic adaptor subunit, partial [Planctomycetia bacterium]|nr:HlyD family efflux transporter periplasmic adaptor subunit [Planctomycetia bacterium]
MATVTDSLTSSSARPLYVRMRPDLKIARHRYQGQVTWVLKDPVGLKYFRLREEEFAILSELDGRISLDEIKLHYEVRFPGQMITLEEIARYVGHLHQCGLVLTHLPGQGTQLKKRRDTRRRSEMLSALGNILALRFRGVDPQRFLTWLLPYVRWFFSPAAVAACLLLGLSAVSLVAVKFDTFHARLPAFHEFFAAKNWLYLAVILAATKIMHELGHGLTCKHFGGECHQLGVMLLVMTPCLYCDVSDSWMLPSKWRRAAIGAAGMYVELVIASLATFVWWLSAPGLLNYTCLSVMFICSVSTVMFNTNPLLRYDGYFILADLLEIPNLRQKATSVVTHKLGAWTLGLEEPHDRYLPRRHQAWFALYTIGAVAYRWFVTIAVLWFMYKLLEPYGLKAVSQLIAATSLVALVGQPMWSLGKFFSVPGRMQQIKRPRLLTFLAGVGFVVLAALLIPLPHRIYGPLEVQAREPAEVYVEVAGVLKQVHVREGQAVAAGTILAELENIDARLEEAKLHGQVVELRQKLLSLRRQQLERDRPGQEAEQQVSATEEELQSAEKQLIQRQQNLTRLVLRSPRAGTVLPPPLVKGAPHTEGGLAGWSGTPLERHNEGTWLPAGQLLCQVGDPARMEAVVVIDQSDLPFVQTGQNVLLKVDELAGRAISGQIADIAQVSLKS